MARSVLKPARSQGFSESIAYVVRKWPDFSHRHAQLELAAAQLVDPKIDRRLAIDVNRLGLQGLAGLRKISS